MRYQEGIHGIFRNSDIKPNIVSLQKMEYVFRKENPDEQARISGNRIIFPSVLIGMVGFVVFLSLHMENIAMIIAAIAVAATVIILCQARMKSNLPRPEKNPAINCVITVVACLIVVIYNLMCLVGPLKDHTDTDNGTALCVVIGWIGISELITQLIHGIRMNIKCSEHTDAVCIGYTDEVVRHEHSTHVASRCVYEFNHDGETYRILGNKRTNFQRILTTIGYSEYLRYDPENPEFCMVKKFELASFIKAILIGGLCCAIAFIGITSNLKKKEAFPNNNTTTSAIIPSDNKSNSSVEYVDDNTIIITANDDELISETTEETTTETAPEVLGYTDEKISSMTGAEEFLVFNCKVIEKDGDFAYFGNVPGLIITILENKELEVGDEALFVFDKNSHYWNYKLEEGESYLGNRTPEKLEMISEDGKFIITDEYIDFFFGEDFKVDEMRFVRKTDTTLTFENGDYEYDYDLTRGTDLYYWDLNTGDKVYIFQGSKYICLAQAEFYILPENN